MLPKSQTNTIVTATAYASYKLSFPIMEIVFRERFTNSFQVKFYFKKYVDLFIFLIV